jgi:hypothetical protein
VPRIPPAQELFHGSADAISEIRADGMFGGVFASPSAHVARSHGKIVHRILSPRPLTDFSLNYEIESAYQIALELCDGDESRADAIMSPECPSASPDPEDGWELQRLRGVLAARLGFTSVEMRDEHGTTWLCLPGCTIAPLE